MTLKVSTLKNYIANDLNILVTGLSGTGKTAMLKEAAKELNLNMLYFNTPLLDPYIDFRGIPVPNHDVKSIEFYRTASLSDANILFFDEINRADPRTLNQIFEIVYERSFNGVKLPNLHCVVAAINPNNGEYNSVEDLDKALIERFDVYLESEPTIDLVYFTNRFNENVANIAKDWWDEQYRIFQKNSTNNKNNSVYISPRRMEKMIAAYERISSVKTLEDTLPPGAVCNINNLARNLKRAFSKDNREDLEGVDKYLEFSASDFCKMKKEDIEDFKTIINDSSIDKIIKNRLIEAATMAIADSSLDKDWIIKNWSYVFSLLKPASFNKRLTNKNGWSDDDIKKMCNQF